MLHTLKNYLLVLSWIQDNMLCSLWHYQVGLLVLLFVLSPQHTHPPLSPVHILHKAAFSVLHLRNVSHAQFTSKTHSNYQQLNFLSTLHQFLFNLLLEAFCHLSSTPHFYLFILKVHIHFAHRNMFIMLDSNKHSNPTHTYTVSLYSHLSMHKRYCIVGCVCLCRVWRVTV